MIRREILEATHLMKSRKEQETAQLCNCTLRNVTNFNRSEMAAVCAYNPGGNSTRGLCIELWNGQEFGGCWSEFLKFRQSKQKVL